MSGGISYDKKDAELADQNAKLADQDALIAEYKRRFGEL